MSVYKRGNVWWVRFQWRGAEIRRSARTTSRAQALKYENELREQHGRIARGGEPRRTYREAMERFVTEHLHGTIADLQGVVDAHTAFSSRFLHPTIAMTGMCRWFRGSAEIEAHRSEMWSGSVHAGNVHAASRGCP